MKYSPDQPRVPAGHPDGGQWTSGQVADAESHDAPDVKSIIATAQRLNLAARHEAYEKCLDLCYPLLERRQPPGSDINTLGFSQMHERLSGAQSLRPTWKST